MGAPREDLYLALVANGACQSVILRALNDCDSAGLRHGEATIKGAVAGMIDVHGRAGTFQILQRIADAIGEPLLNGAEHSVHGRKGNGT